MVAGNHQTSHERSYAYHRVKSLSPAAKKQCFDTAKEYDRKRTQTQKYQELLNVHHFCNERASCPVYDDVYAAHYYKRDTKDCWDVVQEIFFLAMY